VERGLCFFHAHPEKLADLGRQGGKRNRRWTVGEAELPTIPLNSLDDLIGLLEETINRVRRGPFDLRAANSIGFLAGIYLRALAQRAEAPGARDDTESALIYTPLFNRLRSAGSPAEAADEEKVYDLYPPPAKPEISPTMPSATGESIFDQPKSSSKHDEIVEVIMVEVG
jgi:hypothetical protein